MGKKQPQAPDPAATAAAQGQWNSFTAQQQQALNMVDQSSPWGSLNYSQTGTQTIIDPNGKEVQVPRYLATTNLSPEQQAIFDHTQQAENNLATIANEQSARVGQLLNDPFSYNNQDAENWAFDLASQRILPQQDQNRKALENQLVNSGIRRGTAAWDSEMGRLTNANTDQMNQLALTGRNQGFNEALAQRNQPLNEIIGLMSGSQIQNPNATFAQSPQSGVAGVDYTGLVNQKYQSDMNAYNAKMGAIGGALGGLFSMFRFSDERLKENVQEVGETKSGQPIYTYNYKGDKTPQMGVMAQETPGEAVGMHPSGFLMVDYSKVK
jgi:hypothetical protein